MNPEARAVTLHLSRAQLKSLPALVYLGAWMRSGSAVARSCGMRDLRPDYSGPLSVILTAFHQERMQGE